MTVRSGSTEAKRRGCNGLTGIHIRYQQRIKKPLGFQEEEKLPTLMSGEGKEPP
ncbi:hypothetical protein Dxin01_03253 [Deinococcus xinjiangensis]|uniref:Uncharacterized protein n=1 Tax=Deinococcus xinjiangensis TaxID=457454 RepID=A0ABP9VE39_9DEIO